MTHFGDSVLLAFLDIFIYKGDYFITFLKQNNYNNKLEISSVPTSKEMVTIILGIIAKAWRDPNVLYKETD